MYLLRLKVRSSPGAAYYHYLPFAEVYYYSDHLCDNYVGLARTDYESRFIYSG